MGTMNGKVWAGKNTFHRLSGCADKTVKPDHASLIHISKAIENGLVPCGVCMSETKENMRDMAIYHGISWKEALRNLQWEDSSGEIEL